MQLDEKVNFSRRKVKKDWLKGIFPVIFTASKVLLVLLMFFVFFFSGLLSVTNIEIEGDKVLTEDQVYKELFPALEKKYFLIFPSRKNILLLDAKKLEETLVQSEKILSSVKIKKSFPNSIKITLKKSEPVVIVKFVDSDYMTINKEGYGLEYIREDEALKTKLPVVNSTAKYDKIFLEQKDVVLDPKFVSFVNDSKFFSEKRLQMMIKAVNYDFNSRGKVMEIVLENDISVKLVLDSNPRQNIETLAEIFGKIPKENIQSVNLTLPSTYFLVCKNGSC